MLTSAPTPATWRRLFGALALALVSALAAPTRATKPMPTPPPSSFEHRGVQFVEPKAGTKLSGLVPVKLALGAVPQIGRLQLGLAAKLWGAPLGADLFLPTRDMPNGRQTVVARVTYRDGQVIEARLVVDIYNPTQRLKLIDPITRTPSKGTVAILDLTYSEPVRVEVDFGDLDSAFDPAKVKVAPVGPNVYRVSYPISAGNTKPAGRHRVRFRARNAAGEVVEDEFEIELRQEPLLPIAVTRCLYTQKSMGAMLIDRVGEDHDVRISPGVPAAHGLQLFASPDLVVGRTSQVRMLWKPARDGQSREDTRILIKARGYSGHYLCWIPEGATTGHLELSIQPPGAYNSHQREGDAVPSEVELIVALETRGVASQGALHRFTIRPAGWQRRLTAAEEAARQGKIKKKKAALAP